METDRKTVLLPSCLRRLKGEYVRWESNRLTIQLSTDDPYLREQLRNAPIGFWLKVNNIRTPTRSWKVDRELGEGAIRVDFAGDSDKFAIGFLVFERYEGEMFKQEPDLELELCLKSRSASRR